MSLWIWIGLPLLVLVGLFLNAIKDMKRLEKDLPNYKDKIRLVEEEIHDTPVLLLDDVLSELDGSRQNYLLQSIHSIQTLITCTGLDEFVENHFEANSVFQVVEGSVFHKETGGI